MGIPDTGWGLSAGLSEGRIIWPSDGFSNRDEVSDNELCLRRADTNTCATQKLHPAVFSEM